MSGCFQYVCDGNTCACDYIFQLWMVTLSFIIIAAIFGVVFIIGKVSEHYRKKKWQRLR